jgi:Arylsulfatase A and related enzymes
MMKWRKNTNESQRQEGAKGHKEHAVARWFNNHMHAGISLKTIALLCFFTFTCFNTLAQKPNILWIIAEDISAYIAPYGDSTASTPNINRLAREGIRYTNAFSVAGVCAPSRSAIITGMYPTSIGTHNMRTLKVYPNLGIPDYSVVLPPEVKLFPEFLRRNGYYCTNNAKQDYQVKTPHTVWDESSGRAHWRNRQPGQPFFAVFTLEVTHESRIWTKKNDPLLVHPDSVPLPPYYPESPVIRKDVARMYSNIMEMDQQVGRLLQQLEEDGLLDSTIIFWFSDNGGPLPRGKREIYDAGIKLPLIIRLPGKERAGTTEDRLVSYVDLAPTILSLTGIPVPSYMQGQAFLGSQAKPPRKYIYAARDRMDSEYDRVRAVRDHQFKYIRNFHPEKPFMQNISYRQQMDMMNELLRLEQEGKLNAVQQLWFRKTKPQEELYDTHKDPYELHNLAGDARYAAKLAELRAALEQWMQWTDDKGSIPEKEWVASMWPDFQQPQTSGPVFQATKEKVSISCATAGCVISYQLVPKGQRPSNHWHVYTGPVAISAGQTLYAIAERIGYKSSAIKSFELPQ